MDPQKKLVTYTALALVAEQNIEKIQQIRQEYDPAFKRWPPHINISFPFVAPQRFNEVYGELSESFMQFQPFEITVTQIDSFPHGVIFCKPTVQNNQLQKVYDLVMENFPELVNKKHNGFTPHLTIANKVKKYQIEKLKNEFQMSWAQWKWKCTGLHLLQRQKDTPFHTAKFIPFKGKSLQQ